MSGFVDPSKFPKELFLVDSGGFIYLNPEIFRENFAQDVDPAEANLQPTEKQFRVDGMTIFSFHGTKVVERWNLVDMMSLMEQLRT